jgi:hypothetical protein
MTHTCPTCNATLHTSGSHAAWITPDGRVILTAPARVEIHPTAQNWLAEIFRIAHETAQAHRAGLAA